MSVFEIDALLRNIKFDKYFLEATFQFKLLMQLAKIFNEDCIFPERNIEYYNLNSHDFSKKETDIIIEQDNDLHIAIELKMPMNGQVPEQMFKFVEDIKFLEELKATGIFGKCYFIVVTNDSNFWHGSKSDGIYSFFRNEQPLKGKIYKPTGNKKKKDFHQISGEYHIKWNSVNSNFRYFSVEV
ncbi:MAG: hypothetical protein Ta2A_18660 [Treponemataceae bacterium]|nr:MAG: hypothetical protein Ta2A_18660 [Treponemataceae bacterium]